MPAWDKAVSRFAYFGWPNAILQAIYAFLDGVAIGEVPGAPKEYRGGNGAAIASHMIAAQRTEGVQDSAVRFCGTSRHRCRFGPDKKATSAGSRIHAHTSTRSDRSSGVARPGVTGKVAGAGATGSGCERRLNAETEKALVKFQESEKLIKAEKAGQEVAEANIRGERSGRRAHLDQALYTVTRLSWYADWRDVQDRRLPQRRRDDDVGLRSAALAHWHQFQRL